MILIGLTGDIRDKIFFFDKAFWHGKEEADPSDPIPPPADGFDRFMTEVLFQ